MKKLRQLCATAVLAFAVAFSAHAGEIECGVMGTSPPPSTSQATTAGDIETGVTATDPATDIFLSLLQSLLSLF